MKKLSVMTLGLAAIFSLSNCTKEDAFTPGPPSGNNNVSFPNVYYSQWSEDQNFAWSDVSVNADPYRQSTWETPELTEEMINNGGVLVYAKSDIDGTVQPMPVAFFDAGNGTDFHMYQFEAVAGSLSILHSKSVDGVYETPADMNGISFRYVFVEGEIPPAYGRTPTNVPGPVTVDQLRSLPYDEVVLLLGIPK